MHKNVLTPFCVVLDFSGQDYLRQKQFKQKKSPKVAEQESKFSDVEEAISFVKLVFGPFGARFVFSLTSVVKTVAESIAVDSRVPGNREECPLPQAKQCSPQS